MTLRVDGDRLAEDFAALAGFGASDGGGVTRVAYSAADQEARDWIDGELEALGLAVTRDAAGNSIGLLAGADPDLDPIAVGSHTDSVPDGGRYDGALGVVAGLACVRAIREEGIALRHPLALVNFQSEEATMGAATIGSRAFVGDLDRKLIGSTAFDGLSLSTHLRRAGLDPERLLAEAGAWDGRFAAFLELHVEQGAVLEECAVPIGIVQGVVGIRRYRINCHGVANHAGTTPMDQRLDALVGAAPLVTFVRDLAISLGIVGTVGNVRVLPGSANVIPGRVELDVEFRGGDQATLLRAEEGLRAKAEDDLGMEFTAVSAKPPQAFAEPVLQAFERAAEELGLGRTRLWSGAGHDAGVIATTTPAAMVFVPSKDGISHSPDEFTDHSYCVAGTNVLLQALIGLDALRSF
ncbi:MAG: Zn-dependent hydrolase [Actinobacteria bacterium]|nr:Zn-dependent hydrolase [Actinomycetota bacterium]